jgi:hypothetical protein
MDIESQQLVDDKPQQQGDPPKWLKWMPIAALIVSICSFIFALTVLYPWHLELSKEFTDLSKKITCNK